MQGLGDSSISIEEFSVAEERELKRKNNPMASGYGGDMELGEIQMNQSTSSGRTGFGLGRTMRDLIHDRNTTIENDETYLYRPEETEREEDYTRRKDGEDEDIGSCLPKCLLAGFLVLAIIGGMIALLVSVGKDDQKAPGKIVPDPTAYSECSNLTVKLGMEFSIECMVNNSHLNWAELMQTEQTSVISPDQVAYNLTADSARNISSTYWEWTAHVPVTVMCPLSGWWTIQFRKKENWKLLYSSSFYVTISEPTLNFTYSNSTATCSITNGCGYYDIKFVDSSTNYFMDGCYHRICEPHEINGKIKYFFNKCKRKDKMHNHRLSTYTGYSDWSIEGKLTWCATRNKIVFWVNFICYRDDSRVYNKTTKHHKSQMCLI